MRNLLRDLLGIVANPYGNVNQRAVNAVLKHTVNEALDETVQNTQRRNNEPITVSSRDKRIDKIVNEFNLGDVGSTIQALGYDKPDGMSFDDASTRAFIKLAESQGVSLDDIEKLLELNLSNAPQALPGQGVMRFSFAGVTDELRDAVSRIADEFTLGNIAALIPEVTQEQSKQERSRRAQNEQAQRDAQAEEEQRRQPGRFDRLFNFLSDITNPTAQTRTGVDSAADLVRQHLGAGYQGQFQQSAAQRFMESFSAFMGVDANPDVLQQTNLATAIQQLTGATQQNTAATNRFTLPLTRFAARAARSFIRTANRVIPRRMQARMQRFGAMAFGRMATHMGIPAGTGAAFGSALGAAAGPLALVAGITLAATTFIRAMKDMASEAYKTTIRLSGLEGGMALANSQLEVGRFMRDIRMAQMGGSLGAARLNAQNRLEEAMLPWKTAAFGLGNRVGTAMTEAAVTTLTALNDELGNIGKMFEMIGGKLGVFGEGLEEAGRNARQFWAGGGLRDTWRGTDMAEWFDNQVRGDLGGRTLVDELTRERAKIAANAKPRQPLKPLP